jgi:hypothetical protein
MEIGGAEDKVRERLILRYSWRLAAGSELPETGKRSGAILWDARGPSGGAHSLSGRNLCGSSARLPDHSMSIRGGHQCETQFWR